MLQAHNVSYGWTEATLLDQVSLTVGSGEFVALLGPNGAGKSTLLKILSGELRPADGRVLLDGQPIEKYSKQALALRRAVMPQEVLLTFSFTAEQVVSMGRYPHATNKRPGRDDATIVKESMGRTETSHLKERTYPTLSGGEQARVTLARVLAQETPLIFLDEPTASLDPRHQHLVMGVARDIANRGGSIVAVLHDLNLASLYADKIIMLAEGEVKASGKPTDVLTPVTLETVFQSKFHVVDHPLSPRPVVLSLPS